MGSIAYQITSLMIVYSTVYSDADQRKHQSSASLAFVRGIHRGTGEFPVQMASNAENVSIWWRHDEYIEIYVLDFMDESLFLSLYTTDRVHFSLSIP